MLSFGFVALPGIAQQSHVEGNDEAKDRVEKRVVVTGSRLRRGAFTNISPLAPPKTTINEIRKALINPDTRVYALNDTGNGYNEIRTEKDLALLSPDQLDTVRFLSNPIARSKERNIVIVNADDILKQSPAQKAAQD